MTPLPTPVPRLFAFCFVYRCTPSLVHQVPEHGASLPQGLYRKRRHAVRLLHEPLQRGKGHNTAVSTPARRALHGTAVWYAGGRKKVLKRTTGPCARLITWAADKRGPTSLLGVVAVPATSCLVSGSKAHAHSTALMSECASAYARKPLIHALPESAYKCG